MKRILILGILTLFLISCAPVDQEELKIQAAAELQNLSDEELQQLAEQREEGKAIAGQVYRFSRTPGRALERLNTPNARVVINAEVLRRQSAQPNTPSNNCHPESLSLGFGIMEFGAGTGSMTVVAPHGTFDQRTARLVQEIKERYPPLNYVIASGYQEPGHRINVNRLTEIVSAGAEDGDAEESSEPETERALRVYNVFKDCVDQYEQQYYVEIHGYPGTLTPYQIQVATVNITHAQAEQIRTIFNTRKQGILAAYELKIEPVDNILLGAGSNKRRGMLSHCNNVCLHFEIPRRPRQEANIEATADVMAAVLRDIAAMNIIAVPRPLEICDGLDNNEDGQIDEMRICNTPTNCGRFGHACIAGQLCESQTGGCISPPETICDNLDNNQNSQIDEGCDDDNDDYCDLSMAVVGTPTVCPRGGGDCNDFLSSTHPSTVELCFDNPYDNRFEDQNCNGVERDGCGPYSCRLDSTDITTISREGSTGNRPYRNYCSNSFLEEYYCIRETGNDLLDVLGKREIICGSGTSCINREQGNAACS